MALWSAERKRSNHGSRTKHAPNLDLGLPPSAWETPEFTACGVHPVKRDRPWWSCRRLMPLFRINPVFAPCPSIGLFKSSQEILWVIPSTGKRESPAVSLLIVVVLDSRLSPGPQSGLNLNTEFETTDFITPKDFGAGGLSLPSVFRPTPALRLPLQNISQHKRQKWPAVDDSNQLRSGVSIRRINGTCSFLFRLFRLICKAHLFCPRSDTVAETEYTVGLLNRPRFNVLRVSPRPETATARPPSPTRVACGWIRSKLAATDHSDPKQTGVPFAAPIPARTGAHTRVRQKNDQRRLFPF